jgi:hypothetical protein
MAQSRFDDVINNTVRALAIPPAVYTADTTGTVCDMLAADGLVTAIIAYGVINDATTGTITFEESDASGSGFAAITGATVITVSGTADNTMPTTVSFERTKRYLRVNGDFGGTISIGLSCVLLSQKKSY